MREVVFFGLFAFLSCFVLFCLNKRLAYLQFCQEGANREASYILSNVLFSAFPNPEVRAFPNIIHCQ